MSADIEVYVDANGTLQYVHDDALAAYLEPFASSVEIRRASHVEPAADGRSWEADLAPVGGPKLIGFKTRAEALLAERDWLQEHYMPTCVGCADRT